MAWDCCEAQGERCTITPMAVADLPEWEWDGPAVGRKAAFVPSTGCVYMERDAWNAQTPAGRAWVYFHEIGHKEGAMCEPCADRRAGEWVSQLGLAAEAPTLLAIDATLEHRPTEVAIRAYHAGYGGRAGALSMGLDKPIRDIAKSYAADGYAESEATGYRNGSPFALTLAEVRPGIFVAADIANDWGGLFSAAESWGIGYTANTSFRTEAEQQAIWDDRTTDGQPNANWDLKGPAARPGYSEHQEGKAVDLTFASDDGREQFATIAEQWGIFRDSAVERWHFAHGGTRRYPLASDPIGNVVAAAGGSVDAEPAPPGEPEGDPANRWLWLAIPLAFLIFLTRD